MPGAELITLFGDELPEVDSARIGMVLASGTKVSMRDLAQMLLAVAVAELLERGEATITETETKKLLRTKRTLVLQASASGDGLAGAIGQIAREGAPVDELVVRLLGGAVATPETALIRFAQMHLESTGALVAVEQTGVRRIGKMLGANPYEIDAEQAEALRPDWERVRERWNGWKAANSELAERLLEACRSAIGNARDTSD